MPAAKSIGVGFGGYVAFPVSGPSVSFEWSINGTQIHCTNTSQEVEDDPVRVWTWTTYDQDGNVLDSDSDPDEYIFDPQAAASGIDIILTALTKHRLTGSFGLVDADVAPISIPDVTAPAVPAGITVLVHTGSEISGTATTAPDTDGDLVEHIYELYDSTPTLLQTLNLLVDSGATTDPKHASPTWAFTGAFAPDDYEVRARSSDGLNFSAWSTPVATTVPSPVLPPPGAPVLSGQAAGPTAIALSWVAGSDTTAYQPLGALTGQALATLTEQTPDLSFIYTNASPEATYDFRVQGLNADHLYPDGTNSNLISVTTPAPGAFNEPAGLITLLDWRGGDADVGVGRYLGFPPPATPGAASYTQGAYTWLARYQDTWQDETTLGLKEIVDALAPFGFALQKNHPTGSTAGFQGQTTVRYARQNRLYIRMSLLFSNPWQFLPDKWFYFGSPVTSATTSANFLGFNQSLTIRFQSSGPGTVVGADGGGELRSQFFIEPGTYQRVEIDMIAQSAPGVADARFFMWVNGNIAALIMNKGGNPKHGTDCTGVGLELFGAGTTALDKMKYGGFQWFEFWGGSGTKTQNDHVRCAEIYVSGEPT